MKKLAPLLLILPFLFPISAGSRNNRSALFTVTAYCLSGTTATGDSVGRGTIAVDPDVIRLGSRLFVEGYGSGRALDTGTAVNGFHIDVWMGSCSDARQWGSQKRRVRW